MLESTHVLPLSIQTFPFQLMSQWKVNQIGCMVTVCFQSFSISSVPTHITINVSGVLYAGIALTLTCSYPNIPDLVNTDVQITWSVNGSDVTLYSAYHAGKFIFTLSPLKTSHSGRYSCLLIGAAQQNHDRAQEPARTDEYRILVESKFVIFKNSCLLSIFL